MREQVITHKVGNRTGIGGQRRSGASVQRPTRRESSGEALAARLRALLGYVPAFLKFVLAVVIGLVVFAGYRAAASASFFQIRNVEVQGVSRVSSEEVQTLVRKEVEKTGVWKADLNSINARLERLPWIKTAVVSRVLPDGIRVRIVERVPRAVVRTASGRFRWVDEEAALLGEMLPTDQIPSFFLRGLNEEDVEGTRPENRERVAKFIELQGAWDAAGLSERVSEVNVLDIRDIRAQLAGDNSQIEVRLGSQDHGKRLKDALEVLDAQKQSPHGSKISYIDMSQGKRAIVGLTSGAHAGDGPTSSSAIPVVNPVRGDEQESVTRTQPPRVVAQATRTTDNKANNNRNAKPAARKNTNDAKKPERARN